MFNLSVIVLGFGALSGCGNLESITTPILGNSNSDYKYYESISGLLGGTTFNCTSSASFYEDNYSYLKKVTLTKEESLKDQAFCDGVTLEEIYLLQAFNQVLQKLVNKLILGNQ